MNFEPNREINRGYRLNRDKYIVSPSKFDHLQDKSNPDFYTNLPIKNELV